MSKQAQEHWTRGEILTLLDSTKAPLIKLEKMAQNGGKMPAGIRRKLSSTIDRIEKMETDVRSWAITEFEKETQIAARSKIEVVKPKKRTRRKTRVCRTTKTSKTGKVKAKPKTKKGEK